MNALVLAAALALPVWAHEGEDHGGEAAPAPTAETGPRAAAATEEVELVAVLEGKRLVLYLDRFATNEPMVDAQVEVEGSGLKAVAAQIAPGVYAVPAEALAGSATPARHALAVSVQAGDIADLLTVTLDLSKPVAGVEHAHFWGEWAVWGASGALLLAGAGLVALRRRKKHRKHTERLHK